jgi:FlaA1/EpsC-like NDP-sugar epimerase
VSDPYSESGQYIQDQRKRDQMIVQEFANGGNVWPDTDWKLGDMAKQFKGRHIVVTGAAGSLGGSLMDYFSSVGANVIGVDWNEWEVCKKTDIVLSNYLDFRCPALTSMIFHCAAYKHIHLAKKNYEGFYANDCKHVCDWLMDQSHHLPNSTKFLFVSTDKAAGRSDYGKVKKQAEDALTILGAISVRLVNVLGSVGSMWWNWNHDSEPWMGPSHVRRYWMSKADAVRAVCQAALELPKGVYSVHEVPEYTVGDLAQAWQIKTGRTLSGTKLLRDGESDSELLVGTRERSVPINGQFMQILENK